MFAEISSTIFVLTDTPGAYGDDLHHGGKSPVFVKNIDDLLLQLKAVTVAGLVLEMDKVMKGTRKERDRLFNYAGSFPVMRTKLNPRHGFVAHLDPKDCFLSNLEAAIGKRCRNHERIPVKLDCAVAQEDDPSLARAVNASIHDISPGGCFINSQTVFKDEHFVHLRIPHLSNPRPIYSSLRWTRLDKDDPALCGMGVMFIDLADDQLEEILALKPLAEMR